MKSYTAIFLKMSIALLFTFFLIDNTNAQKENPSVDGNEDLHIIERTKGFFTNSKKSLYIPIQIGPLYTAPDGVDIVSAIYKTSVDNSRSFIFMLLSNGHIVVYDITMMDYYVVQYNGLSAGAQPFTNMAGDDFYVLTNNYLIYKSSNNGKNFFIDTAGLNGAQTIYINIDTFQNVYAAGFSGLYSQTLTGTTWIKNTHYPASSCNVIYADRRNRLFAASGNRLYKSINTGASFTLDTAGIGTKKVISIGDDKAGNIYVVVNSTNGFQRMGDRLYRSDGGTAPFVSIDMPITSLNADVLNPYIFNQISGDSILFASTQYGLFKSNDFGATWAINNQGIRAESFFGLVKANNGRLLTTTGLGCFKQTAVDSVWNKVYPAATYAGGQPVFKDNSGNLYTRGAQLFSDCCSKTRMVVKSTDNGVTWLPDTLGIYRIQMYTWFVDENGVQHAAQYGNGIAPIQLFAKQPGLSWVADNAGYTSPNSAQPITFGSNGAGKIYFSQTGNIVWSKQGAANWMQDATGLNDGVYNFTNNSTHAVYAGAYTGVWKQNANSSWTQLNNPPSPTGAALSAFAVTMDSHDKLWAAFSYFDIYYNAVGTGVFYTTNDGATWLQPSFQIDTITFRQLVAIGDSVYGLSYYNGAYLFRVPSPPPVSNGIPPTIDSVAITYTALSNTSGVPASPYYTNYPPAGNTTATVYRGDRFELSLKVNNGGGAYNIAVWADYNNDNIFDPSENIILTSRTAAVGSNWIQVPLTLSVPTARLRIRVSAAMMTANDCCSTLSNGETEDYTLSFNQSLNCRWTGRISANWHDAANWSCGIIPDATKSVMIPAGTPFNCEVINADVIIDRIWIQPGATITVKSNRKLNMNGTKAILTW